MWFAGKLLPHKGKLSDRLGRNDKQKVIVRLQRSGEGPPAREAVRVCTSAFIVILLSIATCSRLCPQSSADCCTTMHADSSQVSACNASASASSVNSSHL